MKKVIALQGPSEKQIVTTFETAKKNKWWITYEVEVRPEHDKKPHSDNINKVPQIGMLLKGVNGFVYEITNLKAVEVCFTCATKATHRIGKKFYCEKDFNALVITKPIKRTLAKQHRNAPCECGSGKKYKHCCARNNDRQKGHFYNSAYNPPQPVDQK